MSGASLPALVLTLWTTGQVHLLVVERYGKFHGYHPYLIIDYKFLVFNKSYILIYVKQGTVSFSSDYLLDIS